MSVTYEYFGPHGERRTVELDESQAAKQIGDRVMVGFTCIQRHTESPDGSLVMVVYFQSEVTGSVWALYYA
jgi:hypothetical protein